ncbi:MAG: hypothetical protein HYZ50_09260 [Deltaproteobacteria bacterium]|nr:hypothetical protein [Deltaproteobacteria bacterium]
MYTLIFSGLVGALVGAAICAGVYRLGVRHGRAHTAPFPLYEELLDHRIDCLGQDPLQARIEVENTLAETDWAA